MLAKLLQDPVVGTLPHDERARLDVHRSVLERKPMIREVFVDFHRLFRDLERKYLEASGLAVEVGAGVAPMRSSYPDVLCTDIVHDPNLDCVVDAQRLPFADASVRVLYAQNSFHHLPDPARFLRELERVLAPKGGALLIEPYHGPVASFVYPRLFASEGFDKHAADWIQPATGPMHGANQAQSYVVFVRDRAKFDTTFPGLELVHQEPIGNYIRYVVSGGLNFRQLAPDWAAGGLRGVERALAPLNRFFALHHVVVLRKR